MRPRIDKVLLALCGCIALAAALPRPAAAEQALVFAAASLRPALERVLALPESRAIGDVRASYAASSQLARQIEAGAPANVFISADQDWMDYLDERGLVVAATRRDLLGNALVLIAPATTLPPIELSTHTDLAALLGADGRLALAEPGSVPAGRYAKAALTSLGLWDAVQQRIIAADNVRSALRFVARREAPLGIVYRTDALSEASVQAIATFPASTHPPIVYPVAIVAGQDRAVARELLQALQAPAAQAIFREAGFDVPARAGDAAAHLR